MFYETNCVRYPRCFYVFIVDMDKDDPSHISRSLYGIMTQIVGNKKEVSVRRTATNLRDKVLRLENEVTNSSYIARFSGSKADGFRCQPSSDEWIFVLTNYRVIPSDSYIALYETDIQLLLMESEMTKPGYTLIRLPDHNSGFRINNVNPFVSLLNGQYLSSKKWRQILNTCISHSHEISFQGPCTKWEIGGCEFNNTWCLKGDIFPINAQLSFQRLRQSSWPTPEVIHSIENDGVLFVPVGSKQTIFWETEWMISYSQAEMKLIHSMNHTQFLCYALLKMFFKEAIDANKDVKGLLSCYFTRTALFWEIATCPDYWNPSTLLSCFWKCFSRLLQWMSNSHCPHFFVPEDNMFEDKLDGKCRDMLLQHLRTLHREGYKCLLRCPSFAAYQMPEVLNGLSISAQRIKCTICVAKAIIIEQANSSPINPHCLPVNKKVVIVLLNYFMHNATGSLEGFIARNWMYQSLSRLCVSQSRKSLNLGSCNKMFYKTHMQRMEVYRSCRTDSACNHLYQAMECYNLGKYSQTLKLTQRAKKAIFSQCTISSNNLSHDKFKMAGVEYLPMETVMMSSFVDSLRHDNNIAELYIEDKFSFVRGQVSPAICALLLQYLCYSKLRYSQQRDEALYDMFLIIQHGNKDHIDKRFLDTAWQILGICQQMSGYTRAAFHSYRMALHTRHLLPQETVFIRLGTLIAKCF